MADMNNKEFDKFNEIDDIANGLYFRGDTHYKEEYVLLPLGRYMLSEMKKGRKMEEITQEEIEPFKIINFYKDYDCRLLASIEGIDLDKKIFFDIPKLCAYIREQKKKGRDSSDITLEEVKHLIIKNPDK